MEIKAILTKPYNEEERNVFIIEQNHNKGYEIRETEEALEAWGYTEEEIIEQRKANFEQNFLATPLGNYRLQPKGYANAQQSIDTINNIVNAFGGLNEQVASMVIFYPTPDFTKEEECTEEWLIAHQTKHEPCTIAEFMQFYIDFQTRWATEQYQNDVQTA